MRFDPDEAGNPCYAELKSAEDVIAFFEREFPDATPLIENLAEDFLGRPPSPLCTVRCSPYHKGEKVVLLGDAAHAVVPFYGQGMNAAFESARLLDELLAAHAPDTGAVAHSAQRVDDGTILQLALDHFADMSSSTSMMSSQALLEVHLENHLHRLQEPVRHGQLLQHSPRTSGREGDAKAAAPRASSQSNIAGSEVLVKQRHARPDDAVLNCRSPSSERFVATSGWIPGDLR